MLQKNYFIILLLFIAILLCPIYGYARKGQPLVPNYPLQHVIYIYGKNKDEIQDTADRGGTPVSCAKNSKGMLYVLYTGNRWEIQAFDQQGKFKFRFGEKGDN